VPEHPVDAHAHAHADKNPYRMTLAELEEQVHVPYKDLVAEHPTPPARDASAEWEDDHRQLRLAGGA
jgi:hypothetical protein